MQTDNRLPSLACFTAAATICASHQPVSYAYDLRLLHNSYAVTSTGAHMVTCTYSSKPTPAYVVGCGCGVPCVDSVGFASEWHHMQDKVHMSDELDPYSESDSEE